MHGPTHAQPDAVSRTKTLAVIGVPDEEAAHLRLLLRSCAADLQQEWRWGDETGADLLVVDSQSFSGQMARTRALGAGVRCAVFSDEPVEDAELVLHRPLRRADVVSMLNRAGSAVVPDAAIAPHADDFYTRDVGDGAPVSVDLDAQPAATAPVVERGLDEALRPEPMELRESQGAGLGVRAEAEAPVRKYASREEMLEDTAPRKLREFLDGDLLKAPVRYALRNAPELTLDPKNRVAHAASGLAALAPYCSSRWRRCDWQPLTNAELADARETQESHSYARLVWLDVLLGSGGQLARHLDPGGTYRLKQWVEIEKDLNRYFRIGSALLQPMRLHEIATAAEASMADVFDFVNACDAIGLIEWQPRARRDDGAGGPKPSLFGKLRNSFNRS